MTLLVLLAPFVVLIRTTNGAAEAALSERFETRATLTASFTRAYIDDIAAREQAQAHRLLVGPQPAQADFDQVVQSLGLEAAVLLDDKGRLLQVWPSRPELIGQDMTVKYAHLRSAVAGQISVSEMVPSAAEGVPVTAVAVPFESVSGRRVFSGAFAPATTPLGAYFASVNPITGGDGFLVDGSGDVLANGGRTDQFSAALGTLSSGVNEIDTGRGRITAAVAQVAGTPWRVVLTAPTAELYAPVRRGRWAPWALLGALAVCGVLVVLLVVRLGRARVDAGRSARTDALTGLPNRRAMDEMLERAAGHSARHREPLAALMIDLDHFKAINDHHGHHVGDAVLQASARALRSASRVGDIVARWGGEEFLVLLPATGIDGAVRAAERLRAAVAEIRVAVPSQSIDITTSVGVALLSHSGDVNALLRAADAALYLAKEDGRNAIVVSPSQETTSTHIDLDVEATAPSAR
ncbi:MAG: sensor domain-containing diguanylate cyclase [Acidimicrobiales bacterium]